MIRKSFTVRSTLGYRIQITSKLKNKEFWMKFQTWKSHPNHDVVRDVSIFIAKEKGYIGDNDLTSSLQRYKLRSGFELLQIRDSDEEINCDGINRDLHVLSIERCSQLTSLPFTQRPNNLITLVLDSCRRLETLSVVGELVNLEILICRNCYSVKELPPEIKGLNRLKVLDLSWCGNLKRIGRGITSSLVELGDERGATVFPSIEHLVLFDLPKLEEICDDRISLNSFQNLKKLKLDDLPVLKQLWKSSQNDLGKDFLPQLEVLQIGNCGMMETVFLWKGEDGNENTSCHHITKIFPKLKKLRLYDLPVLKQLWKSSQNNLGKDFLPQLEDLYIRKCGMMETVFLWKGEDGNENTIITKIFPKLKELSLFDLPNLISLCQGIEGIEFPLLKRIRKNAKR